MAFGLFSIVLLPDISGNPEGSDSQGGGTMDDPDDLSDQSEVESYSYSGPSGEPLSRDTSEPLFDADFQVSPGSPDGETSQKVTSKSLKAPRASCVHWPIRMEP